MASFKKIIAIQESYKKQWLKLNPNIPNSSGIYILTRYDENGFRYAYIGQALHILDRLTQHMMTYQHIDLSLRKHKFYDEKNNPYGWNVKWVVCDKDSLDQCEREYIKQYADMGYQLRNATIGGQDKGKNGLDNNKEPKGYQEGLKNGYEKARKEVAEIFSKYLSFSLKESGKVAERKYSEFKEWLEK